jgi:hypothetical protein
MDACRIDDTIVKVTIPIRVRMHKTTFIGPKAERVRHWFQLEFEGRLLFGYGAERDNYTTRAAALRAGRRAARKWALAVTSAISSSAL